MRRALIVVPAVLVPLALVLLVRLTPAGGQSSPVQVIYAPGWNIVAGPEGSLLSGAVDPIYTLQPGDTDYETFPATSRLHVGWGYWAFFPTGGTIDLAPGLFSYTVKPVPGQFVMIGNPSSFALATISGATYQSEQLVGVGRGAFVMGDGPVTISVPPLGRVPPGEQVVAPTAFPTPRITLQSQPTARCNDGSFEYSRSVNPCVANGGVAYLIPGLPEERVDGTGPSAGSTAGSSGNTGVGSGGGSIGSGAGTGSGTTSSTPGIVSTPRATATTGSGAGVFGTPGPTASPIASNTGGTPTPEPVPTLIPISRVLSSRH